MKVRNQPKLRRVPLVATLTSSSDSADGDFASKTLFVFFAYTRIFSFDVKYDFI
jgi:hypothetical protein